MTRAGQSSAPGVRSEEAAAVHERPEPSSAAGATGRAPGAAHMPSTETLRNWATRLAHPAGFGTGARLPAHSRHCLGCGPDNPASLHLEVHADATGVVAEHRFTSTHVGAPGIVHGGAVSLAFDDLFGFCLYAQGALAVTRNLSVDFLAPVLLEQPYTLRARIDEVRGRRLSMSAEAEDAGGARVATAAALFVRVDLEHFTAASPRS